MFITNKHLSYDPWPKTGQPTPNILVGSLDQGLAVKTVVCSVWNVIFLLDFNFTYFAWPKDGTSFVHLSLLKIWFLILFQGASTAIKCHSGITENGEENPLLPEGKLTETTCQEGVTQCVSGTYIYNGSKHKYFLGFLINYH